MKKALLILSVCGSLLAAGGGSSVGTGSPAAVLCKKKGGVPTIITDVVTKDQNGLCVFDGAVNEWTLFRHTPHSPQTAVVEFFRAGSASCEGRGGRVRRYLTAKKQSVQTCAFTDRSEIEMNSLLGGPERFPGLARALESK